MKRVLVFAIVAVLLAVMVSSASADEGNIKGDVKINTSHVVIEPPSWPDVASNPTDGMTTENKATPILF